MQTYWSLRNAMVSRSGFNRVSQQAVAHQRQRKTLPPLRHNERERLTLP